MKVNSFTDQLFNCGFYGDPKKVAISTESEAFSFKKFSASINCLSVTLKKYFLAPDDTVAVLVSSPHKIATTCFALARVGAKALVVDTSVFSFENSQALKLANIKLAIAEEDYISFLEEAKIQCVTYNTIDFTLNRQNEKEQPLTAIQEPLSFYSNDENGILSQHSYSFNLLSKVFIEYDTAIQVKKSDVLLISAQIPFIEKILTILWALSRGIHTVLASPKKSIPDYFCTEDKFSMDFGLFYFGSYFSEGLNKYDILIDTVKHADARNYKAVWTPERHFNEFGGLFPNPSVLSAALSMITNQIDIRTGSLVAPLHDSLRIAEDWAVNDNLSEGRIALSFASGWQCNDFVFCPENYSTRHEYMLKQIEEVKRLWAGEYLERKNGIGEITKVRIFPRPIQKVLPIWVTVSGKIETFIDAGKIGANILTHLLWQDPSELIEKIEAYRQSLKDSGHDPNAGVVTVMLHTFIGNDDAQVKEMVKKPLKEYIRSSVHLIETMTSKSSTKQGKAIGRYGMVDEKISEDLLEELLEIAFERFFENAALLGSPEKCARILKRLNSYGIDELACLIDFGLDNATIKEGLKMLDVFKSNYNTEHMGRFKVSLVRCQKEEFEEWACIQPHENKYIRKIILNTDDFEVKDFNKEKFLKVSFDFQDENSFLKIESSSLYSKERNINLINSIIAEDF